MFYFVGIVAIGLAAFNQGSSFEMNQSRNLVSEESKEKQCIRGWNH